MGSLNKRDTDSGTFFFLKPFIARAASRALSAADKARDEKRWTEAIEAYAAFLLLKPDSANAWVQLGHCLRENGKATEAEKAYLKALDLDPENPDILLHLGRVRRSMNDLASAAHYFERAAAFASPSLDAATELQALRARSANDALSAADKARDEKRWTEAIEAYAAFLLLKPDFGERLGPARPLLERKRKSDGSRKGLSQGPGPRSRESGHSSSPRPRQAVNERPGGGGALFRTGRRAALAEVVRMERASSPSVESRNTGLVV